MDLNEAVNPVEYVKILCDHCFEVLITRFHTMRFYFCCQMILQTKCTVADVDFARELQWLRKWFVSRSYPLYSIKIMMNI